MRWLVEVSSLGKTDLQKICVEAESWQRALQAARSQRGEDGPMSGFSIELLEEGYRAVDPLARVRFVVKRAPDDMPITAAPAKEAPKSTGVAPSAPASSQANGKDHAAPPAAGSSANGPSSTDTTTPNLPASPSSQSVSGGSKKGPPRPAAGTAAAALSQTETSTKSASNAKPQTMTFASTGEAVADKADVVERAAPPAIGSQVPGLPTTKLIASREQNPNDSSPLTYREYAFFVPEGTTEETAADVLRAQLRYVEAHLASAKTGKLVNLAAFDVEFTGKPPRAPLATLTWKDWKGEPVIAHPKRGGPPSKPPRPPSQVPASLPAEALAAAAPVVVPQAPPAPQFPQAAQPAFPPPQAAAPAPPPAAVAPSVPPPAPPAHVAPSVPPPAPPVVAPAAPPVAQVVQVAPSVPPPAPPVAAPAPQVAPSVPPPPAPAPPVVAPSAPPPPPPAAAPVVVPQAPPAPVMVESESKMPSQPPAGGPGMVRTPSGRFVRGRVTGDELITSLFDSMHDLHFLRDALDGGQFCLALATEVLPARAAIIHFFDIEKREWVVACTRGKETQRLLTMRHPENDEILREAARKRRALVVSDATMSVSERYRHLSGARSLIAAPIMQAGRALGALEIINPLDGMPFTEDEGNAMTYIAEQYAEYLGSRGIVLDRDRIQNAAAPR